MAAADVAFENVTKRYKVPPESGSSSDGLVARMKRRYLTPSNLFTAVRNLSFEVPHGQALGIIGHNGAGKSTILKLLSGITTPSEGLITVCGRVAALLEVGSGFHPELTGRENIFLSGSLLGMTRREIHRKLESIIDFAEIRSFVDVPVKRYSSGMYVRLGFSIAAHLEPDVLLLDEVLAVGDATFQQKSKERILELKQASTTIIFISHDLHAVQQVCDRVLVIKKGVMIYDGDPHSAIVAYEKSGSDHISPAKTIDSRKPVSIVSMDLLDSAGRPARSISTGSPLRVRVHYRVHVPVSGARLLAVFHTPDWQMKCSFTTAQKGEELDLPPGECAVEFACDELALQPGLYMLDAVVERAGLVEPVDWIPDCKVIQVTEGPAKASGNFYHSHTWSFLTTEETAMASRGAPGNQIAPSPSDARHESGSQAAR